VELMSFVQPWRVKKALPANLADIASIAVSQLPVTKLLPIRWQTSLALHHSHASNSCTMAIFLETSTQVASQHLKVV
jgi:hypothetical protein